jgi:hypothetical protein
MLLALAGCKASAAAGSGTPSAPPAPAASAATSSAVQPATSAAAAADSPSPNLSIPGTHKSVQTYQVSASISTLIVTSHIGNITITGSNNSQSVEVTEQIAYSSKAPATTHAVTTHAVTGQTLTLAYTCPVQLACGVAYVVTVPRGVAVQATTTTGAIRLSGLAGQLTAKTDVGFIDATGLTATNASLTADLGGISAAFTTEPDQVTAVTRIGGITVSVPATTAYRVTTQDFVGKTTISVPESTTAMRTISVRTDVGAIAINLAPL